MDSYDDDERPGLAVHPALLDALAARDDRCMASLVMSVLDVQLADVFRHRTKDAPRSIADATLQTALGAFSARNDLSLVMGWCSPDGHHDLDVLNRVTEALVRSEERRPSLGDDPAASLLDQIRMPVDDPRLVERLLISVRPMDAEDLVRAFDAASPLRNRFQKAALLHSLLLAATVSMPFKANGGIGSILR